MHLIVDGYNLIRQWPQLERLDAQELEAGRQALLALLGAYRRRSAHKVTVVFDGWQGGQPQESRDRSQGVMIIYSRLGERADEVIKRLLAREQSRAVVVSSDRELQDAARQAGAAWMDASQFAALHLTAMGAEAQEEEAEIRPRGPHKKGPSRRAPKAQRRISQRLKKL